MTQKTGEGDVLQNMCDRINDTITDQLEVRRFADAMSSAGFIPEKTASGITGTEGISNYAKVSRIMSCVKSHITSSQVKSTQEFDSFLRVLRDLRLDDLALQLEGNLGEGSPTDNTFGIDKDEASTSSSDEEVANKGDVLTKLRKERDSLRTERDYLNKEVKALREAYHTLVERMQELEKYQSSDNDSWNHTFRGTRRELRRARRELVQKEKELSHQENEVVRQKKQLEEKEEELYQKEQALRQKEEELKELHYLDTNFIKDENELWNQHSMGKHKVGSLSATLKPVSSGSALQKHSRVCFSSGISPGFSSSIEVVSQECSFEAAEQVDEKLKKDCNPVAIAVLVSNDNLTTAPSQDHSTPVNAEKSGVLLKKALESYGIMVISIVNKSMEYLSAVLENLTAREIPKSCLFLWFIFSGHGKGSAFCLNGKFMKFNSVIHKAAQIRTVRRMGFFFDCCQLGNWESIKVVGIPKEHMTVYSAPPNGLAFHHDGVGLMVTCLAQLLQNFTGSLSELQSKLRDRLRSTMIDLLAIPSDDQDEFILNHLPHHTSSMFDINLYNEVCRAMQPIITVAMSERNHKACVSVYSPQRMMHHPSKLKFELHSYKYIVKMNSGDTVELGTTEAEFKEDSTSHVVSLPPQAHKMAGKLMVGAVYGDGTEVLSGPIEIELPCYRKPSITCCTSEENGFKVCVAYNPKDRDSEAYRVEWIEIGYHDPSHPGKWEKLHREEGGSHVQERSLTLPPSPERVKRDLQVAVKYICCPDVIFSDSWTVEQPGLSKPVITSVEHRDGLTGILKFAPNQNDVYRVRQYSILSQLRGSGHWVEVHTKTLSQGDCLSHEEVVSIPLHLVGEASECEYKVTVKYLGLTRPVVSEASRMRLEQTDVPTIDVSKSSLLGSKMTIKFAHPTSYSGIDSDIRRELKYEINGVATCASTFDRIDVQGGLDTSFRVKVSYGDRSDLGHIYSDTYKPRSYFYSVIRSCWKINSNLFKVVAPFVIALLVAFAVLFLGIHFPRPLSNELIVVEQMIPFQLKSFSTWCGGASALEYTVEPTDFTPGFDISAYSVDSLAIKTEHYPILSTRYPYINETIKFSDVEAHYFLPINYYMNPPYLLEGSVVSLRCKIDLPENVDVVYYTIIHFFDSMDDAVKYQQHGVSNKPPVHSINITGCAAAICTKNYTIAKNSFYFPVLSSKSDSSYQVTINFTFEVYGYVDPSTLPSAVNVANFSKSSSGKIPLHQSKVILLYAHPPNATAYERLAHLHFSCVPHYALQVPLYLVFFLSELAVLGLYSFCWCRKCRRNRHRPADAEILRTIINETDPDERTPLILY